MSGWVKVVQHSSTPCDLHDSGARVNSGDTKGAKVWTTKPGSPLVLEQDPQQGGVSVVEVHHPPPFHSIRPQNLTIDSLGLRWPLKW